MIRYSTKKKQRTGLLPAEADRNMASPTESAAIQDWAKGTLRSWYAEMTSRHIRCTRYVQRVGIPSAS